jgi:putative ABC transport system substrate-binding protein
MTATSIVEAKKFGLQSAAQSVVRSLLVLKAGNPQAIDLAFATLVEQQEGALLVGGDPFLVGRSQQIVAMATRHAIPTIYDFRESDTLAAS